MANFNIDLEQYKNVWGIYCIINTANNKRYIGSAVNLQERIKQHYTELSKGVHFNDHLQRSWEKYGEESFELEILETVINIEYQTLLQIEDNYINQYNTIDETLGYNKRTNSTFPILSEKSIKIRAEKHELTKIKLKAFYADTGKFYKDFDSVTQCAKELNDQTTNVSEARDKITHSVKGFVIISADKYNSDKCYKKQAPDHTRSEAYKEHHRRYNKNNKKVYSYSISGEYLIEYFSCSEASRQLGLPKDALSHLLKRKGVIIFNNLILSSTELQKEYIINNVQNMWKYIPGTHPNQFNNK